MYVMPLLLHQCREFNCNKWSEEKSIFNHKSILHLTLKENWRIVKSLEIDAVIFESVVLSTINNVIVWIRGYFRSIFWDFWVNNIKAELYYYSTRRYLYSCVWPFLRAFQEFNTIVIGYTKKRVTEMYIYFPFRNEI